VEFDDFIAIALTMKASAAGSTAMLALAATALMFQPRDVKRLAPART